jgi:UDP-2,4-diacetamido-2,4,6-trideoxy-beta-L-altropyranose hydrolase
MRTSCKRGAEHEQRRSGQVMARAVFRVDASGSIGGGHIVRCLALARELQSRGCSVYFVSRDLPEGFAQDVAAAGVDLIALPPAPIAAWEDDARQTSAALDRLGPVDWIVTDHYGIDERWEAQVKDRRGRLLVIDDLARQTHVCDMLLNQNLIPGAEARYRNLVPSGSRLLLGPRYALLREEFRAARGSLKRDPERLQRIVISMGTVDPAGATLHALRAIDRIRSAGLEVTVVVGRANPHRSAIEQYCSGHARFRVVVQSDAMAHLIAEADLAIGAGGSSLWERCCLGLPALVIANAENQHEVARSAAEAGCCLYGGPAEAVMEESLDAMLKVLIDNPPLRKLLSEAGLAMVDGYGCGRVARQMLLRPVRVRRAVRSDAERVYAWRNAPETRRFTPDPRPLLLDAHLEWFYKAIRDDTRVMLIGEDEAGPFGVLRYDLESRGALVSIYLDPERRGRGLGAALLSAGEGWMLGRRPDVVRFRAEVQHDNAPSRRLFAGAGFAERGVLMEKFVAERGAGQA